MPSYPILALASAFVTYVFVQALVHLTQDSKEPPLIQSSISFLSATFNMMTHKANYYVKLWNKHHYPICTIRGLGPRMYIANSLSVIKQIDRKIHTVAFTPIQLQLMENVVGVSDAGLKQLKVNHLSEKGCFMSFPRYVAPTTTPGDDLDRLVQAAVAAFAESFDKLASKGVTELDLFDWAQDEIFTGTNEAIYGPHNPFRKPDTKKAWFSFEPGLLALLIGFMPKIFASQALRARESMVPPMVAYLQDKRHLQGSPFLQRRLQHLKNYDLGINDSARAEISHVIASISNTVPSVFWVVWQLLSDDTVFRDCYEEVCRLVQVDPQNEDGLTVDLAQVSSRCPILVSTWRENLRFHGISVSARVTQEDTMIDQEYLLKKDSVVMVPNGVLHRDESLWGPTANTFDHKRFVKSKTAPAAAFRGFGSGHVLCPGRHFVTSEVLAFVALLILRFEVRPTAGKWSEPGKDSILNSAFPTPKKVVKVEFRPRDNKTWRVSFSSPQKKVQLTAEDALDENNG